MSIKVVYPEKTTPIIEGIFKDRNDQSIGIEELKLTIHDSKTKEIINGRDNAVLIVADFVNGTTGVFEFPMTIADMTIVRSSKPGDIIEHIVRFDYTWNSGTRSNSTIIPISIKNMDHK